MPLDQQPPSMREIIARAICPTAFENWERNIAYALKAGSPQAEAERLAQFSDEGAHPFNRVAHAYERADAVLDALPPFLLRLVDHVWQTALEDQSVPSTDWAERMIAHAFDVSATKNEGKR